MIIALQKKKQNIAEYVLYMWQIEDIIRSCNFEMDKIKSLIIDKFNVSLEVKLDVQKWYEGLIAQMKEQRITERGHLEEVKEVMAEMEFLHNSLLKAIQDPGYLELYEKARPNILYLQNKSGGRNMTETETCLTGLFGLFVLRLKKKQISEDTSRALETITRLMGYLSAKYREMKPGDSTFTFSEN